MYKGWPLAKLRVRPMRVAPSPLHHEEQTMPGQAIGTRIFVAAALAVLLSVFVTLAPASAVAKPAWLAPVVLSAAGVTTGDGSSQVAVDPQGEAVDVWTHTKGSETVDIEASSRPPGGAWQAPVRLSPPRRPGTTLGP